MAEEAALNFEDAIELGKFKVNLFPFCTSPFPPPDSLILFFFSTFLRQPKN